GHQGALGHVIAVIDRFAGADAIDESDVLVEIHVARAAAPVARFPGRAALSHGLYGCARSVGVNVTNAFGPHDVVADIRGAAVLLPAAAKEFGPIGVFVNDEMVIEDLTIGGIGSHLPAADAAGLDRILV